MIILYPMSLVPELDQLIGKKEMPLLTISIGAKCIFSSPRSNLCIHESILPSPSCLKPGQLYRYDEPTWRRFDVSSRQFDLIVTTNPNEV